jgi:hypothetical protein
VGTSSNNFTVTLPPTPRLIDALGPTIPLDGSFAVEISVQNEDPTFEAILTPGDALTTINGTAIIAPGTRRIWLLTVGSPFDYTVCSIQNIGTFSTSAVTPGGGTVTSVAQTVPVEFQVTGSPVTSTGTLAISKVNETANTVWAGPTSGGAAQPGFRALVTADLPGGVGSGTVTSVAATVPVEFAISGSPITTSGTLAITKATESANLVWAGPTTGAPAQPAFRSLVAADLPSSLNLNQTFATIGNESATLANSRRLAAGTNITLTDGGAGSTLTIASTAAGGGGGLSKSIAITSSGTLTIPTGVTGGRITMIGAGGGGATAASASGGGGGGAGESMIDFPVSVTAGSGYTVTIGAGGAGAAGAGGALPGTAGGATSIVIGSNTYTVAGGGAAIVTSSTSGAGGGIGGASAQTFGNVGGIGTQESTIHWGGAAGGGGTNTGVSNGALGGAAGGNAGGIPGNSASSQGGGGGGASTIFGQGGAGGNGGVAGSSAASTSYGAGGGGAGGLTGGTNAAGSGAAGYLLFEYVG